MADPVPGVFELEQYKPVSQADLLAQAQLVATRSLTDQMSMLNKGLENITKDMREVRDSVKVLEAQELKQLTVEVRKDCQKDIINLKAEHTKVIDDMKVEYSKLHDEHFAKHNALSLAAERMRGTLLPLGILGSALFAGALSFVTAILLKTFGT